MMKKFKVGLLVSLSLVLVISIAAQFPLSMETDSEKETAIATAPATPASPRVVTMIVTGYSVDRKQCGKTDGITAMGRNGKKFRGVAAANWLLSLGTKVIIPGVGEMIVDDTGGDMRKAAKWGAVWQGERQPDITYHIDLRFTGKGAKKRALAWGRQKLEVTILPPTPVIPRS